MNSILQSFKRGRKIFSIALLAVIFLGIGLKGSGQLTLVNYDFNAGTTYPTLTPSLLTNVTSTMTSTEVFATLAGTASGAGAFVTNSTAGNAISMTNSSGTNTKYFQFQLGGSALSIFSSYKIYFQAQRSGTGAATATIAYSTNGTTFTNFATTQSPGNGSFSECNFDLSSITAINAQSAVYFRILASGASGTGTLRVDNFQIRATPANPTTTSISPSSATAGSGAFTLTVNGTNFLSGSSTVTWAGTTRTTTFVSSSQLTAAILTGDVAAAGTAAVGVTTTGAVSVSNTQTFTINAAGNPILAISGTPTNLGSACPGVATTPVTYTITNSGIAASGVTVTSDNPTEFAVSALSSTTIAGSGGTATYVVTFTPSASGSRSANITVASTTSGSNSPTSSLTGTGTATVAGAVTTSAASSISSSAATLNGNVTTLGICPATTEKGFVYSVTATNAAPVVGGTGVTKTSVASVATGAYLLALTGLPSSTGYSFAAYVYDGTTYTYGSVLTFSTIGALSVSGTTAHGSICPTVAATPQTYTITNSGGVTAAGISVVSSDPQFVVSGLSSTSIAGSGGTATYTVTFTPSSSGAKTAIITVSSTTGGIAAVTSNLTGTGTTPVTPVLATAAASAVVNTTATLNGSVTTLGVCPATTQKGFVYSLTSTNSNPLNGGTGVTTTVVGSPATGAYTLGVTGLTPASGYTYKAFVFDGTTYTYGSPVTFTTLGVATQLAFGTAPSSAAIISTNLTTFTVQALRANSTVDVEYTGNITLTRNIVSGSANLTGTVTVAAVAGVATFSAVQFDATGTYTITAASGALTTVTSSNITVSLAPVALGTYPFTGTATTAGPAARLVASSVVSNVSFSSISRSTLSINASSGSDDNVLSVSPSTGNYGTAVNTALYLEFTVTPSTGYSFSQSSFTISSQRTAAGATTFALRSSANAFASDLGTGTTGTTFATSTITLSGSSTAAVTYRIYPYGGGSTGFWRVDDITLNGNIVCIDPSVFTVTGGGSFCSGGTGVAVGLSGSQTAINYQLKLNGTNTGSPVAGTGSAISFGNQTGAGSYTVVASNTNGTCNLTANMTGTASVAVNPISTAAVLSGSTAYCTSGTANLQVAITGGTSPFTVVYTDGSTNFTVNSYTSGTNIPVTPSATTTYSLVSVTSTGGCVGTGNSGTATVTVHQPSTAAVLSGTATICTGTSTNLQVAITGGTSPYTVVYTDGTTNFTVTSYTSGSNIAVTPSANTTYSLVSVTSTGGCTGTGNSGTAVISLQNQWIGGTSDWSLGTNWCSGTAPTGTENVYIPAASSPYPVLSASAAVHNLNIQSGASVGIGGHTLTINGAVSGTGTITGSNTSSLSVTAAAGTLYFTAGAPNNYLKAFTIGASGSATLGNALNITAYDGSSSEGVLTVTPGGTLTTGGFLTIKSSASGTARIAAGSTSGGYISGNVTVERYIRQNTNKGWRLLATNTTGSQTINAAWQEGAVGGMVNPNPGYGTKITKTGGTVATAQTLGFDSVTAGTSLYSYDAATDNLVPVPNTISKILSSEQGYFLFIRGDRSPGQFGPGAPTTSTTLRSTGTVLQGDQTAVSTGALGWGLARNPYPSRINMLQIVRGGSLTDAYQVWDPKLGGSFGVGGYQTFTKALTGVNTGNYEVSPGGGSYGTIGTINNVIESGAAFFIQGSGSAQVVEAAKETGSSNASFRPSTPLSGSERFTFNVYANNNGNFDMVDGGYVDFDNIFSNDVDINDVRKSLNFGENFGILRNATDLVVERRQLVGANDTVYFKMNQLRQIPYRIDMAVTNIDPLITSAELQDKYTGVNTPLDLSGNMNTYSFTVDATAGSKAADRFKVVFRQSSVVPVSFVSVTAAQAGRNIAVEWKVANQVNVTRYEVEKSADGRSFSNIGTIVAGNVATYNWLDENVAAGNNYYRIKSVDNNGQVKYTGIVRVAIGKSGGITVSPNPVQGNVIHISFADQKAGAYAVRLINIAGQSVYNRIVAHAGGSASQIFALPSGLVSGVYQLEIVAPDSSRQVEKLIVNTGN